MGSPFQGLRQRLERSASTARRGYQLAIEWTVYAAVVEDRLARGCANPLSAADGVWLRLHSGELDRRVALLRGWLARDAPYFELEADLAGLGSPNARELVTSHPYPDVYVWLLRRMFPALCGMPPGLRRLARSSSSAAPRSRSG